VLRRRRRLKRIGLVVALAACYLAGLATMRLWLAPPVTANAPPAQNAPEVAKETPPRPAPGPAAQSPEDNPHLPADVLERLGELAAREKQAELFRRAGDRYLEGDNLPSALRCYRLALDCGSEKDLAIAAEDSWLLMSLKDARQKEKRYAQNGG
jgi:hypothetical protein